MDNLTGRTRYRTGLFGRQILQVEEDYYKTVYSKITLDNLDFKHVHGWRDATKEDMKQLTESEDYRGDSVIDTDHRKV